MNDLTGKIFGNWTVIKKDNLNTTKDIKWICECKCGNVKSVLGKYLINGKSTSCGCTRKKDLTGNRFGKLLVVETLYNYNGYNKATYKCQCDCGNIIYVKGSDIYKRKSCGCIRQDKSNYMIGQKYGKLTVLEILSNYKNNETYCRTMCDCGNEYIARANALLTGNTTSCGCIHSPSLIGKKFGILTVEEYAGIKNSQKIWKCKCECGNITNVSTKSLQSGNTTSCGCSRLKLSKGETLITDILNTYNISFIPQKTFIDCKGIGNKVLRFDFYIPSVNYVIEYDGEQHFKPVDYFGGTFTYEILKKHDKIKNKYCEDNNISLIRFNYKDSEEYIRKELSQILLDPVTTTVI